MNKILFPAFLFVIFFAALSANAQTVDASGRVFYRATVDDRVHVVVRRDRVETRTVSGKANPVGVFSFTSPLPESPVTVSVLRKEGRGKVSVIQQPTSENDYTAIVEIYDDRGGSRDYLLDIYWN